jgi:uncharacterized iron-regulated membrane protein
VRYNIFIQTFDPVEMPAEAINAFQTSMTLAWVTGALLLFVAIFLAVMMWRIHRVVTRLESAQQVIKTVPALGRDNAPATPR